MWLREKRFYFKTKIKISAKCSLIVLIQPQEVVNHSLRSSATLSRWRVFLLQNKRNCDFLHGYFMFSFQNCVPTGKKFVRPYKTLSYLVGKIKINKAERKIVSRRDSPEPRGFIAQLNLECDWKPCDGGWNWPCSVMPWACLHNEPFQRPLYKDNLYIGIGNSTIHLINVRTEVLLHTEQRSISKRGQSSRK